MEQGKGRDHGGRPQRGRGGPGGGRGGSDRRPGSERGRGRPASGEGRPQRGGSRPQRGEGRPPREEGRSSGARSSWSRGDRSREERTADQRRYDGPPIPEEITGRELDRSVRDQLRGLPEKLAARVARHLAAAGAALETDPETAYQHALAARARAARVAVVREAVGETAYAAGHFAEALAELRAARRMNGVAEYLPVMADCERALGRPEKALDLARSEAVATLPAPLRVEMTIVEAGARADLGQLDAALRTLEAAPLRSDAREPWVPRLRYAYADLLEQAGRAADALEWFHRAAADDGDSLTDAAERAATLEGHGGA